MATFSASIDLDYPLDELFAYHAASGAIDRLIPPWENVSIRSRSDSLAIGSEVALDNKQFGITQRWLAKHTQLNAPRLFEDTLVKSPFRKWIHRHEFELIDAERSRLTDRIEYELPFRPLGSIATPFVQSKLDAMFQYRHRTTKDDLGAMARLRTWTLPHGRMPRIAVTGSSGMIGRRVVEMASVFGWEVIRIVRKDSRKERSLYPLNVRTASIESPALIDRESLEGLDAVIHLAGIGIADKRWSDGAKSAIRDSRMRSTQELVQFMSQLAAPPKALVSASGIGFFGDAQDRICAETDAPGNDFLSLLARDWESAASTFRSAHRRVALARFGMVLHPRMGALAKMMTPFRLGLGGPMGSGKQYWPWVHIDDAANILLHLAVNPRCDGPFHVVGPEQVTNSEFTKVLASVLHRPAFIPVPGWLLHAAVGEMAGPLLLSGARATTHRLLESGYVFRFPTLRDALRNLLGM